jgi:hypothetical protein
MPQYKARRPFWSDSRMGAPRRIVRRGEIFETNAYHGQQLQARRIAIPVTAAIKPQEPQQPQAPLQPNETQTLQPQETAVIQPEETPETAPEEVQTAAPTETKEETPQEKPQEPADEPEAPLEDLPYSELKEKAKKAKIKGYNTMKKDQLIKELKKILKGDK